MNINDLANELLLHIFQSAPTISTVFALSLTCKHFHSILTSHRLPTLYLAAEAQYGPLTDAIRVVTHNESQPPHIPSPTPYHSVPLLKQLVDLGRGPEKWIAVDPSLKWRGDRSADRRLLSLDECYRLRRACYRIWLYSLAFHSRSNGRFVRHLPEVIRKRALLLRPWPSWQLAEILDLHELFRQVFHRYVCPSNGTVLRRHKQRWPDDPFPLVSTTSVKKYEEQSMAFNQAFFHNTPHVSRLSNPRSHYTQQYAAVEGWGDEISQYYVVEDMLKVNPGQLMHLLASVTGDSEVLGGGNAHTLSDVTMCANPKGVVEHFVAGLGDWFENNGETLSETVGFVVGDRGGDVSLLRERIDDGYDGIARVEEA